MFDKEKNQTQQLDQSIEAKVEEYKKNWNKGGIIEYKTETFAIINKTAGKTVQFIIAVDMLLEEGYKIDGVISGMGNAGTNQVLLSK